jgi:hypothetical protein
MRRFLIAVMLASLPLSAHAASKDIILDETSCGTWTRFHTDVGLDPGEYDYWVMGFVSGVNWDSTGADIVAGLTQPRAGVVAFLNSYCHDHPLDALIQGLSALIHELRSRAQ